MSYNTGWNLLYKAILFLFIGFIVFFFIQINSWGIPGLLTWDIVCPLESADQMHNLPLGQEVFECLVHGDCHAPRMLMKTYSSS